MTKDTWAIIGTMCAIGSIISALAGIAINQNAQLNTRITDLNSDFNSRIEDLNTNVNSRLADLRSEMNARFTDLNGDIDHLRTDIRGMGERLRNVEIELAGVDRRLGTLEAAIIPDADDEE